VCVSNERGSLLQQKQFPESIALPLSVQEARAERNRQIVRSVIWGISIRLIIIAAELTGFFLYESSTLLLDALSSIVDVFCSLLLMVFIYLAERPPDEHHPFGHGRFEPLAGLQLGLLLCATGGGMLIQQIMQLYEPLAGGGEMKILAGPLWLIPLAALFLLEIAYLIAKRAAKKSQSLALMADAAHYRVDSLTSILATISLGVAAFLPKWSHLIDHLGAISIAILMVFLGFLSVKNNLNQLLDRVPDNRYFDLVRKAAKKIAGVQDTEKIRIQLTGPDAHVDIDIEVDPQMRVEDAHTISQHVRVAIQQDWPAVRDVTVHVEPYYPNDH